MWTNIESYCCFWYCDQSAVSLLDLHGYSRTSPTVSFNQLESSCPAGVTTALHIFCINWKSPCIPRMMYLCVCFYLSGQWHFYRHRYQPCQEAAVEGHYEHHRVVVWENKCNLRMFHRRDMSRYLFHSSCLRAMARSIYHDQCLKPNICFPL